eukprot:5336177-Pyramimonas_sp.AAC.1
MGLVRGLLHLGLDQAPPPGTDELCHRAGCARQGYLDGVICIDGSARYPEIPCLTRAGWAAVV